jgi:hypothetical protein
VICAYLISRIGFAFPPKTPTLGRGMMNDLMRMYRNEGHRKAGRNGQAWAENICMSASGGLRKNGGALWRSDVCGSVVSGGCEAAPAGERGSGGSGGSDGAMGSINGKRDATR